MLPIHQVESFLRGKPAGLQDIVFELRNLIAAVASDAVEVVRWRGLNYVHAGGGGIVSAGICQIEVHADHIRLSFIHGAFLPDPRGLLQGDRKAKRYVRLESYESVPWDDLKQLIVFASQFDPRSLVV